MLCGKMQAEETRAKVLTTTNKIEDKQDKYSGSSISFNAYGNPQGDYVTRAKRGTD